jgi:hypothetical protein
MAAVLFLAAQPAAAQSRPLVTEDPETVPAGFVLFEAGVDFFDNAVFPASGLEGNLWRIGTFGLSFGISSIAEIQIDGGLRNRLMIESLDATAPLAGMLDLMGETTGDIHDVSLGAKIRFAAETATRPAMAIRFTTRLPNAGTESGLGLDTTDFFFGFAIAKTVQSVRVAGNVGLGILPDPVRGDRQNDVLTYGFSVARAVAPGAEIVGEFNGRLNTRSGVPPIGTDSLAMMRVGTRYTRGPVRVDGGFIIGVTERDPAWGFTGGLTWVFRAFTVQ